MNYRLNTRALLFVGVLVLIAIALFAYTLVSAPTDKNGDIDVEPVPAEDGRMITAHYQYQDGLHTLAGFTDVDSPCHTLTTESFLVEDGTVAEVRFSTLLEGENCPQVLHTIPFRLSFEAPEGIRIRATWNGVPARLNTIPVPPGQEIPIDPFIKG